MGVLEGLQHEVAEGFTPSTRHKALIEIWNFEMRTLIYRGITDLFRPPKFLVTGVQFLGCFVCVDVIFWWRQDAVLIVECSFKRKKVQTL